MEKRGQFRWQCWTFKKYTEERKRFVSKVQDLQIGPGCAKGFGYSPLWPCFLALIPPFLRDKGSDLTRRKPDIMDRRIDKASMLQNQKTHAKFKDKGQSASARKFAMAASDKSHHPLHFAWCPKNANGIGGYYFQGVDLSAPSSKPAPTHWTCNKSAWLHQNYQNDFATPCLLAIRSTTSKSQWDCNGNPSSKVCRICPTPSTPFCIT